MMITLSVREKKLIRSRVLAQGRMVCLDSSLAAAPALCASLQVQLGSEFQVRTFHRPGLTRVAVMTDEPLAGWRR